MLVPDVRVHPQLRDLYGEQRVLLVYQSSDRESRYGPDVRAAHSLRGVPLADIDHNPVERRIHRADVVLPLQQHDLRHHGIECDHDRVPGVQLLFRPDLGRPAVVPDRPGR